MTIVTTINKYFIFRQGERIIQTILGEPKLQTFWPSLYSIKTFKSLNFSLFWKNIKSSLIEDAFGKKKVFTIAKKKLGTHGWEPPKESRTFLAEMQQKIVTFSAGFL